jgi:hypothetical protein
MIAAFDSSWDWWDAPYAAGALVVFVRRLIFFRTR